MSAGVFTNLLRVKLVEKSASEVGPGTKFPVKVTPDQAAEILYRIKDAKFTGGSVTFSLNNSFVYDPSQPTTITSTVSILTATADPARLVSCNWNPDYSYDDACFNYFKRRGYNQIYKSAGDLAPNDEPYFGEDYGDTISELDSYAFNNIPLFCRDIRDNERILFLPKQSGFEVSLNNFSDFHFSDFRTGFSYESKLVPASGTSLPADVGEGETAQPGHFYCGTLPDQLFYEFSHVISDAYSPPVDYYGYTDSKLEFSHELAWVKTGGSTNPFAPTNELYLGVSFTISSYSVHVPNWYIPVNDIQSDKSSLSSPAEAVNLVLELAGGETLSMALYYDLDESATSGFSFYSGTDFVLKATEWWPYAKGNPSSPVWDYSTGLKL